MSNENPLEKIDSRIKYLASMYSECRNLTNFSVQEAHPGEYSLYWGEEDRTISNLDPLTIIKVKKCLEKNKEILPILQSAHKIVEEAKLLMRFHAKLNLIEHQLDAVCRVITSVENETKLLSSS